MTIFHRKKERKNKKEKEKKKKKKRKKKSHSDDFGTLRGHNLGAFNLQRQSCALLIP